MPYPVMPDFELRPTVARFDKFLVIASDDGLVRDMIAVQKGGAGFKSSPAYTRLSSGLPAQGNGFSVMTQAFMKVVHDFQKQAMASQKGGASPAQNEMLAKLLLSDTTADSYSVSAHVENGWLSVGKGPTGVGKVLAPLVLAPVAIAAGVALPVFNSVSEKGKSTKGLAQAKQIGLACKIYAADHDGKYPPSLDALGPEYLSTRTLLVSPFAPSDPMGYKYHAGLTDDMAPDTILLEDKYPAPGGGHVTVYLDNSAEVRK